MLVEMATRKSKTGGKKSRPTGTQDVFARLMAAEVKKFDGHVQRIVPKTSRAAVIAMLMRSWMELQDNQEGKT